MFKWTLPLAALASLISFPANAGPAEDAAAAVTSLLDKFNRGDVYAFIRGHRDDAVIIDEFAPYSWAGPGAVKTWLTAYALDSGKRGITKAWMDYDKPIQCNSDGSSAYVVVPTVYSFEQTGRKMAAKGSMTFVMAKTAEGWKISSWTYSGATPTPQ
jgi:ketosteroid isomerase-like protein